MAILAPTPIPCLLVSLSSAHFPLPPWPHPFFVQHSITALDVGIKNHKGDTSAFFFLAHTIALPSTTSAGLSSWNVPLPDVCSGGLS